MAGNPSGCPSRSLTWSEIASVARSDCAGTACCGVEQEKLLRPGLDPSPPDRQRAGLGPDPVAKRHHGRPPKTLARGDQIVGVLRWEQRHLREQAGEAPAFEI